MSTEVLARHEKLSIANQVLVTIAVTDRGLEIYPRRSGDVEVYHRPNPNVGKPERPRQVRWVVVGLRENQTIRIEPKDAGHKGTFEDDKMPYVIAYPDNTITSGKTIKGPPPAHNLLWAYNVTLLENDRPKEGFFIDPDVIIKNDP